MKKLVSLLLIAAYAVTASATLQPLPPLPADDPHLTVGENVERQAQYITDHPIQLARNTAPTPPATISATTNGETLNVPGAPPIPLPAMTNSYFSNTIAIDAGVLTLGVGSTVHVSSYLQGFYNFNQHFAAGVVTEWGAVNVLNAASAAVTVRKIFTDNMEGYAGPEVGYDFANRQIRGGLVVGMRWVPFSTAIPNLATHAEFDGFYEHGANGIPTGVKAGLSYRF